VGVVLGGTLLGLFVGAIPGLGGIVVLVLLLPFLYNVSPVVGLALILAAHSAIYYAGSTTAILINTPGAPESAATCFDGYAMTRRGRAAEALGVSAAATTFGGWFGAIVLLVAIPVMVPLVTLFHPPSYFFLAILAVVIIGQLQSGSATKGLLSGLFGFLLSFFGAAQSTGTLRFAFGNLGLYSGINVATAAIGLFAISEMYVLFARNRRASEEAGFALSHEVWRDIRLGIREVFTWRWLTLRSAIIGVICGVIPGIGSTAANFLSYGQAVQTSKHPERFGTGTPEGVIAPEASSISKEAGSLIPTVALGVPTGPGMAVVLAAFAILGLAPGPSMLSQHLPLVFLMVVVIAVSALLASAIGLGLAPFLAKVTRVPGRVLVPFVLALAAIGAFVSTTLLLQVLIMMLMGVVGLLFRRYNYSLPAVIVGIVLGTVAENNLILTSQLYGWRTFETWLPDLLVAAIIAVLVFGVRARRRQAKRRLEKGAGSALAERPRSWGELLLDVAWVAGLSGYVYLALAFPSPAGLAPTYLGVAALVVAVFQLIAGFSPRLRRFTVGAVVAQRQDTPDHGDGRAATGPEHVLVPEPAGVVAATQVAATQRRRAPKFRRLTLGAARTRDETLPDHGAADGAGGLEEIPAPEPALAMAQTPIGAARPDRDPAAAAILVDAPRPGEALRQAQCAALALALVGGIFLFGFQIAIPVFILLYFVFVYRWVLWRSLLAAAIMGGIAYAAAQTLGTIFPSGVL
jgi:putative tricarboxylic transport membrane protein